MMGWLSKLIVITWDVLNANKTLLIVGKKKLPSNKKDMLESFNIDRVVQLNYYKLVIWG
jgi:hypothetical protein